MHRIQQKIQSPALLPLSFAAALMLALPHPGYAIDSLQNDDRALAPTPASDTETLETIDPKGTLSGEYTFALEEIEDENGMTTIVVTISDTVAEPMPVSDTELFRRELEATLISMLWEEKPAAESLPPSPPREHYASNGVFPDIPRSMLPEPATLALLGLGLACIFLARCRFSG